MKVALLTAIRPSRSSSFDYGHHIEASTLGDYHQSQNCYGEFGILSTHRIFHRLPPPLPSHLRS
ncbi:hypothetical protein TMatcc_002619 [Talaromyces marneffei ATCC 18224]